MLSFLPAATTLIFQFLLASAVSSSSVGTLAATPVSSNVSLSFGTDTTTAEMNAAIEQLLLGKTAFGATPMGKVVKQLQDLLSNVMMPKVMDAHKADQSQIDGLGDALSKCGKIKEEGFTQAQDLWEEFIRYSKLHQACRKHEATYLSDKGDCLKQKKALKQASKTACSNFASISQKLGTQKDNRAIVTKAGSESDASYITRISNTICGDHVHDKRGKKKESTDGWGGGLRNGFLDTYLRAKAGCNGKSGDYKKKDKECKGLVDRYTKKKDECDEYQKQMDGLACQRATILKDTCERYTGCYYSTLASLGSATAQAKAAEVDRKAEWRGLNRMSCLMGAFADGKCTHKEVDACKNAKVNTDLFTIKPAPVHGLPECNAPHGADMYPSTGPYKKAQFSPLPVLAKGKDPQRCSGIEEISLSPRKGSPKSCKCARVILNGAYSAGAMVRCDKCLDVFRSTDKNSCPQGTKLFSPRSRSDWETLLKSGGPLRAPHWIVDVTRPKNGCGGCSKHAMNSGNNNQKTWRTSDGSAWWLRSKAYSKQSSQYTANCFMNLHVKNEDANQITFNENKCKYHSKSYYCQVKHLDLNPKSGSPDSCTCSKVELSGAYSAGVLVKCAECITVSKSTQKNSCPKGMKIFSPRSREDWKTFIDSAGPLRAPHFIIDVTRPRDGCGGCKKYAMNSKTPQQSTWRTSDRSSWWLRSTPYGEPNGDYKANCYLGLSSNPTSADTLRFNDANCHYKSRSYYCQTREP